MYEMRFLGSDNRNIAGVKGKRRQLLFAAARKFWGEERQRREREREKNSRSNFHFAGQRGDIKQIFLKNT